MWWGLFSGLLLLGREAGSGGSRIRRNSGFSRSEIRGCRGGDPGLHGLSVAREAGISHRPLLDGGQGGAEHVVQVIGELVGLAHRMGSNGDTAARVRLDDVDGVVPTDQGESVPEEGLGGGGVFLRRKLSVGPVAVAGGACRTGEADHLIQPAVGARESVWRADESSRPVVGISGAGSGWGNCRLRGGSGNRALGRGDRVG